jgi:hypothetical protein
LDMGRRDFNEEVVRAIDAALSEILGKPTLEVLYKHLKEQCGIGSDQMPYRLPTIIRVLEEIFGAVGASSIGSDVAKKLYNQLGLTFVEHSNYSLEDYVEEARKLLPKP